MSKIFKLYKKTGKNFITPNVIKYRITEDNRIIELSEGEGITGNQIFGVSELYQKEKNNDYLTSTGRGKVFEYEFQAEDYFNDLLTMEY